MMGRLEFVADTLRDGTPCEIAQVPPDGATTSEVLDYLWQLGEGSHRFALYSVDTREFPDEAHRGLAVEWDFIMQRLGFVPARKWSSSKTLKRPLPLLGIGPELLRTLLTPMAEKDDLMRVWERTVILDRWFSIFCLTADRFADLGSQLAAHHRTGLLRRRRWPYPLAEMLAPGDRLVSYKEDLQPYPEPDYIMITRAR
jgi:hypothetical protein